MRGKKVFKSVKLDQDAYDKLTQDKKDFQKTIGGGTWSFSDTFRELRKIAGSKK